MNEIPKTNLTDQRKSRLNEISKIENYFNQETNQRKTCSEKVSKYVTAFDYIDKVLIVFSAASGGICIFLSVRVVGAPIGIAWNSRSKFYFTFFSNHRNSKEITEYNKKQKQKS